MILIVGATGTLGGKVARTLLANGQPVRAMTRELANGDKLQSLGAKIVRGDLRDRESLDFALRGVSTVIAAAHSMLGKGEDASELVDDAGHRGLIESAKQAGVRHFIYTSVVGASPDHPVDFWRTKARVERYLQDSGLTWTIIRPTAFMEIHAYQLIGKPVMEGKRVVLFGPGRNPRNYVAAEDVAKVVVGALQIPSLRGEIIEVGGPENLTAHEIVQTFERVSGRKAKVTHLPLGVVRALSRAMKPLHPGVSRVLRVGVINETTDQTFDPSLMRSRVPVTLTRLEDWVRSRVQQVSVSGLAL
ncbi:MAG: SDR family oxidoreductase [Gemmatimonadaceae bacterium]|nr:SDR family oxidoreductase [Gemmatimonadaceae bacterium]